MFPLQITIIYTSLASGVAQPDFKTAIVKSARQKKKKKKKEIKNFLGHLKESNFTMLSSHPSAPCTYRTNTVLLHVVSSLLNPMEENKVSVLLLVDLSAAFKPILYQIHLSRLQALFGTPVVSIIIIFCTETSVFLSTIMLPFLLLSRLVFHRAQSWVLYCLFCTVPHFQI